MSHRQHIVAFVVRVLLGSPKVLLWFANSLETVHPKLHPLPIGLHAESARAMKTLLMGTSNATKPPNETVMAKFSTPNPKGVKNNPLFKRSPLSAVLWMFRWWGRPLGWDHGHDGLFGG